MVRLLERILSRENMQVAWKRVKANKGAAGVDGISIDAFLEFARDEWEKIREKLLAGTYQGLLSVKELWVHIHYPATAR